jgi:diacylglycerol kinase family enzyme
MNRFKVAFLINPISGGGEGHRIAELLPEIMDSFTFQQDEWHIELTRKDEFVTQIKELLPKTHKLIAVGGDGTMATVLNEIALSKELEVEAGLIPLGTGNDLARVLHIYNRYVNRGLLDTVKKLIHAPACFFDLWQVHAKRSMAAYFSMGLDSRIVQDFQSARESGRLKSKSVLANKAFYLRSFLKNSQFRIPEGSKISWLDNQNIWRSKNISGYSVVAIGNIPSYAGGFNIFPGASFNDGLLNITFIQEIPDLFKTGFVTPSFAFKQWQAKNTAQAKKILIEVPAGTPIQIDGEDRSNEWSPQMAIESPIRVKLLNLLDL